MRAESCASTVHCSFACICYKEINVIPRFRTLNTGHTSQASIPNFSNFLRYAALDLELLLLTKKILLF